jgi:uncharacterized membrane protein YgcG
MRIARPRGLAAITRFCTVSLLAAMTFVAPVAAADPPLRLPEHITDKTGALTPSGRSDVESAIQRLYDDRKIQLWVVYVPTFDKMPAVSWAQATMHTTNFGDHDALLAVAVVQRQYAFEVPPGAGVSSGQVDDVRHNKVEPALKQNDWSGAAVAAANGLDAGHKGGFSRVPLPLAIGVIALALVVVWLLLRRQRKRRQISSL